MLKTVQNEEYMDTQEVLTLFGASKKRFYSNIKPRLRVYHFDALKTPWYRRQEVLALKEGKAVRKGDIAISGINKHWSRFLKAQGYRVDTQLRGVVTSHLPEDAVKFFHLPADQTFVKTSKITFADRAPICTWDTYYPASLISDELLAQMENNTADDVPLAIKEQHGLVIANAKDRLLARITTFEEQTLFQLVNDEAVQVLQRASYTSKNELVLFSDMALLGSWFAPEYPYAVDIWDQ